MATPTASHRRSMSGSPKTTRAHPGLGAARTVQVTRPPNSVRRDSVASAIGMAASRSAGTPSKTCGSALPVRLMNATPAASCSRIRSSIHCGDDVKASSGA